VRTFLLKREQWLPAPIEDVFAFFSDAANLEAITPPWLRFRIVTPAPIEMRVGTLIEYRISWRVVPIRWLTEIAEWSPSHRFVDTQVRGPYRLWHHTHTFAPLDGGTLMNDIVRYALPMGILGTLAHRFAVRRDLEAVFDYRAEKIGAMFGGHAQPNPALQHVPTNASIAD
jgi:ligand-binding SRPBCC domain-containing protein